MKDSSDDKVKDRNDAVLQLVKSCTPFLSANSLQFGKKCYDLDSLNTIWNQATDEDYSEDVYKAVAEMFASHVFRPLPPSSYTAAANGDETAAPVVYRGVGVNEPVVEETAEAVSAVEFTQTAIVYQAFQGFVERALFDPDRAAPHLHRRFVNGLAHRLNSGDTYERAIVRDIMSRTCDACPSVRADAVDAAVAELADFAYGYAPRHNGVDDLFEFLSDTVVVHSDDVRPESVVKLSRILIHLLKHHQLLSFKSKLIDCVKAIENKQPDLVPRMLKFILKLWTCNKSKTLALLRTMIDFYDWCDKDKWMPLQLQIVGQLSKLFSNDDFQLADESMNFWNRILHENVTFWQNKPDDVRNVVNALKMVKRTHWNSDCGKMANSLLNIMAIQNVIKESCLEDKEETFLEGMRSGIRRDFVSQHIMMPLKNFLTLPSLIDKKSKQESTTVQ